MNQSKTITIILLMFFIILIIHYACTQADTRTISGKVVLLPDTTAELMISTQPPVWPPDTAKILLYHSDTQVDSYPVPLTIESQSIANSASITINPIWPPDSAVYHFTITNLKPGTYRLGVLIPSYSSLKRPSIFYKETGFLSNALTFDEASFIDLKSTQATKVPVTIRTKLPVQRR